MKIVIIDSGIDLSKNCFNDILIKGFGIKESPQRGLEITNNFNDKLGHGTAVASIIARLVPEAELIIFKIFNTEEITTEEYLITALRYIYENIECDIINISSGIIQGDNIFELEQICIDIEKKGTIIVSAFDNNGSISYPAAFNCVIGVCASRKCRYDQDFIYISNSTVNVFAKGINQKVVWTSPETMIVSGSSFAAPYVTAFIAKLNLKERTNCQTVLCEIRKHSTVFFHDDRPKENITDAFSIKKAVAFPFNKEMHALFRFRHLLPFEIKKVFNFKYLGNIGKKVDDALSLNNNNNQTIDNIENIDWSDDFDTFILGHCDDISNIVHFDVLNSIVLKCLEYNKNLFLFDNTYINNDIKKQFEEKKIHLYCPEISDLSFPADLCGKLYISSVPIISVVGTSSKQGKFSLQLMLRHFFIKKGFRVGQLGTEPTSKLFGFDEVYPIGLKTVVSVSGGKSIAIINSLMHRIERKKPDIIITGAQSNILPRQIRNLGDIPFNGYEYLIGTNSDCTLLCVDYEDSMEFIKRSILYVETLVQSHVLGIVVFPLKKRFSWSGLHIEGDEVDPSLLELKKKQIETEVGIHAFINGKEDDIDRLGNECIDFFST